MKKIVLAGMVAALMGWSGSVEAKTTKCILKGVGFSDVDARQSAILEQVGATCETIIDGRAIQRRQSDTTDICGQAKQACSNVIYSCRRNARLAQAERYMCQNATSHRILLSCLKTRNTAAKHCRSATNCLRQYGCMESVQ